MTKKPSGVWNYVAGDEYSIDDLMGIREFFIQDYESAKDEHRKALSYRKYGLPGWRWYEIKVLADLEISEKNLEIVGFAIKDNLKRQAELPEERRG